MLDVLDTHNLSVKPKATEVVIGEGGATVVEWDLIELRRFLWENRDASNALQTFIRHDLRNKLSRSTRVSLGRYDVSRNDHTMPKTLLRSSIYQIVSVNRL
jgi:hypothetical protein